MARLLVLLSACALSSCSPSQPQTAETTEDGVCWRVQAEGQTLRREVLDRNIDNLQTCASRLEAVRMMEGGAVEGFFEGRSIFATAEDVTQAPARGGTRYPVFDPEQRLEVQAAIQTLLDRKRENEGAGR